MATKKGLGQPPANMMKRIEDIVIWLRDEHERVVDLSDHLTQTLASMPQNNTAPWLVELIRQFEAYRAHFEKHMALEEQDGYLAPVRELSSTLAPQIDRLLAEHREISLLLTSIKQQIDVLTPDKPLLIQDCLLRIGNLVAVVREHESQENSLVSRAFTEETGTRD